MSAADYAPGAIPAHVLRLMNKADRIRYSPADVREADATGRLLVGVPAAAPRMAVARALRAWMTREGLDTDAVASRLGTSEQVIGWLSGQGILTHTA